jgi:hypothetical protein
MPELRREPGGASLRRARQRVARLCSAIPLYEARMLMDGQWSAQDDGGYGLKLGKIFLGQVQRRGGDSTANVKRTDGQLVS